jgi:NAD(P)H-nitrite reductase large subunit
LADYEDNPEAMVCDCLHVDWRRIELAIRALGLKTVEDVTKQTGAGGGCHSCWPLIEGILERCARGQYRFEATEDDLAKARREAGRW